MADQSSNNANDLLQERITKAMELVSRSKELEKKLKSTSKLTKKSEAELKFLYSLRDQKMAFSENHLKSTNLTHVEAVLKCAEEAEDVTGVFKSYRYDNTDDRHGSRGRTSSIAVDVVADGGALWIKAIARKASALHLIWQGEGQFGEKDVTKQAKEYLCASQQNPRNFIPPQVMFVFFSGVTESIADTLRNLGVLVKGRVLSDECAKELKSESPSIDSQTLSDATDRHDNCKRVNLDITSLIALVSALTNGGCGFVFKEPILTSQAEHERKHPLLQKLNKYLEGKELFACQSAVEDFNTILDTIGGEKEKERARLLLQKVTIVKDNPSFRAVDLPITGRIKHRSQVIFGTGDSLQAITTSANSSFVRAAEKQGVSFAVYLHDSRALTESKERSAERIVTDT